MDGSHAAGGVVHGVAQRAREFLPGGAQRLAPELLTESNQEQAALGGGVPDAVQRGSALRERLGLVDPDFDFDLSLGATETTISIRVRDDLAGCRSVKFVGWAGWHCLRGGGGLALLLAGGLVGVAPGAPTLTYATSP